jgi:EmrB/QacA subfamily drug resistance transporter
MSTQPVTRRAPDWLVLTIACAAQFMVLLDVSIVNVALPSIRHSLGFSQTGLQWVLNAYTLTFAGFLLLGGRTADLFGRRRIFLTGVFVFTAASLLGGFAQDQWQIITARAIQGLGGAILSPTTLTILTTTFTEPKARSRAMGTWSAVAGAGGATGALLGGVLTQELSWRWILFINVPIGIALFVLARTCLVETRAPQRQPLDLTGSVLVTAGLTALVYGLVRTDSVGWTSWQTIVALVVACGLVGWFLVHEARVAAAPIMPLRLFARRSIWSSNLTMLTLAAALFPMWFFVSLYLQEVLGYSPLRTGFAFIPQTIAIIAGAQLSSRLVLRVGARALLVVGTLLTSGGLLWISQIGPYTAYWSGIFGPSVLITLGLGLSFTPIAFAATAGVAPQEAGLASGLVNTSRQIGGAIGLAALATIASTRSKAVEQLAGRAGLTSLTHTIRVALTDGYALAFKVGAAIALLSAMAALTVPRLRRPSEAAATESAPAVAAPSVSPASGSTEASPALSD